MGRFPSGQREQTVNLPLLASVVRIHPCPPSSAGMAELADAHDSGSCVRTYLQVQVLFPAPVNPLIFKGFQLFWNRCTPTVPPRRFFQPFKPAPGQPHRRPLRIFFSDYFYPARALQESFASGLRSPGASSPSHERNDPE